MMLAQTRQFFKAKDLLFSWTGRIIRARYQQSALGWFWAIIQPGVQVLIFTIIFTMFLPIDTGNIPYPVFSFVAVAPWSLLASSLPDMTQALIANMNLVTKIYFPREILPAAAFIARLMDFGVAILLLIILIVAYRVPINPIYLLFLPLIIIIQMFLILGLGFALSAANVFFRDVHPLLLLIVQVWFYACPIIYPTTMVPGFIKPFYFFNPMAGVIQAYRDVILNGQTPGTYLIFSAVISLLLFGAGYWFFKRVEFQIADIV